MFLWHWERQRSFLMGGLMMHVAPCTRAAHKESGEKGSLSWHQAESEQELYLGPAAPGGVCKFCKSFVSGTQSAPTLRLSHLRDIDLSLGETGMGQTSRTWLECPCGKGRKWPCLACQVSQQWNLPVQGWENTAKPINLGVFRGI